MLGVQHTRRSVKQRAWNTDKFASYKQACTHLQRGIVDTQLIAHDKEVYDIAWGGIGVFASVSADGSVRVFDLRSGHTLYWSILW